MKVEDFENVQKFNALSLGEGSQVGNTILEGVSGTNDIVANASPSITALVDGQTYIFTAPTTNTDAMTLTIDATATLPIKKKFNIAMVPDDIKEDQIAVVVYSSATATFELISTISNWPYMNGILAKAAPYTVELKDRGVLISVTGTTTITMLPVATAGDGFNSIILNSGVATVTVDGDSAETINGTATITLDPGEDIHLATTGAIGWEGGTAASTAHDHTTAAETLVPYTGMTFSNDIDQDDIASSAIGQGELITTTDIVSTSSLSLVNLTFAGGSYGFYPQIRETSPTAVDAQLAFVANMGSSYVTNIAMKVQTSGTIFAQQRYVQASPPYDLGDGEIPLFIFAVVNAAGNIESIGASPDPVWANNGPTNIRADRLDKVSGRKFKTIHDLPPGLENPLPDTAPLQARINHQQALAEFMKTPAYKEIEITAAFKNSDMDLMPHPFIANDLTGKTIVLLDPVSSVIEELLLLHESGESVNELLHEGYFNIDATTPKASNGPPGVQIVSVDWKNTP
jgi:hypothetical protein